MKQTVTLLVFLLTVLSSCCNKTSSKLTENNPLDSLVLVDTVQMKTAFLNCINQFINGVISNGVYINNDIFVIQPAYNDAFMGGEWSIEDMYPSHYFKVDNRIVFLCSRSDSFMRQEKYKKAYHQIVPDGLHDRYDDYAFILIEHNDNKATLLSSDEIRKRTISPISPFRKRIKFIPPKIK